MGWLSRLFWSRPKKVEETDRSHSCCSASMGWSKVTGSGRVVRRANSGWKARFFGRHGRLNQNGRASGNEIVSAPGSLRSSVRHSQNRKLSTGSGQSQFNRFAAGRRSSRKFKRKSPKTLKTDVIDTSLKVATQVSAAENVDVDTPENVAIDTQKDTQKDVQKEKEEQQHPPVDETRDGKLKEHPPDQFEKKTAKTEYVLELLRQQQQPTQSTAERSQPLSIEKPTRIRNTSGHLTDLSLFVIHLDGATSTTIMQKQQDSAIDELLEGRMELSVRLPHALQLRLQNSTTAHDAKSTNPTANQNLLITVDRRTPMLDVLIQLGNRLKFSVSEYRLSVNRPYKPSTAIGSLDVNEILVEPRTGTDSYTGNGTPGHHNSSLNKGVNATPSRRITSQHSTTSNNSNANPKSLSQSFSSNSIHKLLLAGDDCSSAVPFQTTFRLQVNLPRNQLMVFRVTPSTRLEQVQLLVCEEKQLPLSKYRLVVYLDAKRRLHPQLLQPVRTLAYYAVNELWLISQRLLAEQRQQCLMADLAATRDCATCADSKLIEQSGCHCQHRLEDERAAAPKKAILSLLSATKQLDACEEMEKSANRTPESASKSSPNSVRHSYAGSVCCSVCSRGACTSRMCDCYPLPNACASTDSVQGVAASRIARKKKSAPPPPPLSLSATKSFSNESQILLEGQSTPDSTTNQLSHSRSEQSLNKVSVTGARLSHLKQRHNSGSDSSGYHESVVSVDSPEGTTMRLSSNEHRAHASVLRVPSSSSTVNKKNASNLKKRRAPEPPRTPGCATLSSNTSKHSPTIENKENSSHNVKDVNKMSTTEETAKQEVKSEDMQRARLVDQRFSKPENAYFCASSSGNSSSSSPEATDLPEATANKDTHSSNANSTNHVRLKVRALSIDQLECNQLVCRAPASVLSEPIFSSSHQRLNQPNLQLHQLEPRPASAPLCASCERVTQSSPDSIQDEAYMANNQRRLSEDSAVQSAEPGSALNSLQSTTGISPLPHVVSHLPEECAAVSPLPTFVPSPSTKTTAVSTLEDERSVVQELHELVLQQEKQMQKNEQQLNSSAKSLNRTGEGENETKYLKTPLQQSVDKSSASLPNSPLESEPLQPPTPFRTPNQSQTSLTTENPQSNLSNHLNKHKITHSQSLQQIDKNLDTKFVSINNAPKSDPTTGSSVRLRSSNSCIDRPKPKLSNFTIGAYGASQPTLDIYAEPTPVVTAPLTNIQKYSTSTISIRPNLQNFHFNAVSVDEGLAPQPDQPIRCKSTAKDAIRSDDDMSIEMFPPPPPPHLPSSLAQIPLPPPPAPVAFQTPVLQSSQMKARQLNFLPTPPKPTSAVQLRNGIHNSRCVSQVHIDKDSTRVITTHRLSEPPKQTHSLMANVMQEMNQQLSIVRAEPASTHLTSTPMPPPKPVMNGRLNGFPKFSITPKLNRWESAQQFDTRTPTSNGSNVLLQRSQSTQPRRTQLFQVSNVNSESGQTCDPNVHGALLDEIRAFGGQNALRKISLNSTCQFQLQK